MNQTDWEIHFWKNEFSKGADAFLAQREADWKDHARHFPELSGSKGDILEIGTGLVSVFEFSDRKCVTVDPLQADYLSIFRKEPSKVDYRADWEGIAPDSFDEILCVNVIDHAPDPAELLERAKTALKPGGRLYFQVNFDADLSPAHYGLWDKAKVDSSMAGWRTEREASESRPEHNQTRFWAVYVCEKQASSSQATPSTKRSPATRKSASTPSKGTRKGKTSKS